MTATDKLRCLLDELGVEHYNGWSGEIRYTKWQGNYGMWFLTHDSFGTDGELLYVQGINMTPEQAVEATLGLGTCKVDVLNTGDCAGYECSEYIMHCNGCGHEFGHVLYNEDGDVWMSEPPRFCPNCGRKVVDE